MSEIKGNTPMERTLSQLDLWAAGESVHDDIDQWCCPDFSCCNKLVDTPIQQRKKFVEIFKEKGEDGVSGMLAEFLGKAINLSGVGGTVKIIGGEVPGSAECCDCKKDFENYDLRPYGPGGSLICFNCAMKPGNREQTDLQFNNVDPRGIISEN